jgi:hypothetical protein
MVTPPQFLKDREPHRITRHRLAVDDARPHRQRRRGQCSAGSEWSHDDTAGADLAANEPIASAIRLIKSEIRLPIRIVEVCAHDRL